MDLILNLEIQKYTFKIINLLKSLFNLILNEYKKLPWCSWLSP